MSLASAIQSIGSAFSSKKVSTHSGESQDSLAAALVPGAGVEEKRRISIELESVVAGLREIDEYYGAGVTPAEAVACEALKQPLNTRREELLRELNILNLIDRYGRLIDLPGILSMIDKQMRPIWTLANPSRPVSAWNGRTIHHDGPSGFVSVFVGTSAGDGCSRCIDCRLRDGVRVDKTTEYIPASFPVLPQRIRNLWREASADEVVEFAAILYKPEDWVVMRRVVPDPALIIKVHGVDAYFCRAIWGGDRPQIEEFI